MEHWLGTLPFPTSGSVRAYEQYDKSAGSVACIHGPTCTSKLKQADGSAHAQWRISPAPRGDSSAPVDGADVGGGTNVGVE